MDFRLIHLVNNIRINIDKTILGYGNRHPNLSLGLNSNIHAMSAVKYCGLKIKHTIARIKLSSSKILG
jgi:hypothetical protein